MKRTACLLLIVWVTAAGTAWAGAVVTQNRKVSLGEIKVEGDRLVVKLTYGQIKYDRSQVLWFAADPKVTTFLAAGRLAEKQRQDMVAKLCYEESLKREPATAAETKVLLAGLRQATAPPAAAPVAPPSSKAEAPPTTSVVSQKLGEELLSVVNGKLYSYQPKDFGAKQYYIVYYGSFSGGEDWLAMELHKLDKELAAEFGHRYAILIVNSWGSEENLVSFILGHNPTWLAVRNHYRRRSWLHQFFRNSTPALVLLNRNGEALATSNGDGMWVPPHELMAKVRNHVKTDLEP